MPAPVPRWPTSGRPPNRGASRVPEGSPPTSTRAPASKGRSRLRIGGLRGGRVPAAPVQAPGFVDDPSAPLDPRCSLGGGRPLGLDQEQSRRRGQEASPAHTTAGATERDGSRSHHRGGLGAGSRLGRARVAGDGDRDATGRGARAALGARRSRGGHVVRSPQLRAVGGRAIEKETKTHQMRRISLDAATVQVLAELRQRYEASTVTCMRCGTTPPPSCSAPASTCAPSPAGSGTAAAARPRCVSMPRGSARRTGEPRRFLAVACGGPSTCKVKRRGAAVRTRTNPPPVSAWWPAIRETWAPRRGRPLPCQSGRGLAAGG